MNDPLRCHRYRVPNHAESPAQMLGLVLNAEHRRVRGGKPAVGTYSQSLRLKVT